MAYRFGNRKQMTMLPQCIEDYVEEDASVRAYDTFINALDFDDLGIELNPDKVGNSQYDPRAMLKLLVYSYSYGVHSSRKIEREVHYNMSFIWLTGGLKPDHKTIAEFRRKNIHALKKVLKQTVRICIKLNLIDGNTLFVDGSKFRANAARENTHRKEWYVKQIGIIDKRIDELLAECENIDKDEEEQTGYVRLDKKISQSRKLKEKIKQILSEMDETKQNKTNMTDPDCVIMKGRQGSHASYNVQSVVDDKNGLIVHSETVRDNNDLKQFANQVDKANQKVFGKCQVACADSGYAGIEELEKIDKQGIHVVVPSKRQALHKPAGQFDKSKFMYNKKADCYYCSEGHQLKYVGIDKKRGKQNYQIAQKDVCISCRHYGKCTSSKYGRRVSRYVNEETRERFERQYQAGKYCQIYAKRKMKVEHPFGHIKRNLGYNSFLLRGLEKVEGEISLLSSCFNLTRMINIMGVERLIEGIKIA